MKPHDNTMSIPNTVEESCQDWADHHGEHQQRCHEYRANYSVEVDPFLEKERKVYYFITEKEARDFFVKTAESSLVSPDEVSYEVELRYNMYDMDGDFEEYDTLESNC